MTIVNEMMTENFSLCVCVQSGDVLQLLLISNGFESFRFS